MPTREHLAGEAFALTARYDTAIARWFAEKGEDFPPLLVRAFEARRPSAHAALRGRSLERVTPPPARLDPPSSDPARNHSNG